MVDGHFADITELLTTSMAPASYSVQQKKELVTRAADFTIIAGQLYKLSANEILCRYVLEHEKTTILIEAHDGVAGGHYAGRAMTQNILRAGLWWSTLHQDSYTYFRSCDTCQRTGRPS